MGRKGKVYIIIGVVLFILLVFIEYTKPKKISWFPSYNHRHTIPFGMKIIHEEMQHIFQEKLKDVLEPPFSFLDDQHELNNAYFFVNEKVAFGKEEMNVLLNWVSKGNQLFIASGSYEKELLDTLGLETDYMVDYGSLKAPYVLSLQNKAFRSQKEATFDRPGGIVKFFTSYDSIPASITALGELHVKGKKKKYVNIIQKPFGKGQIILSLFPQAFTNYFILKNPNEQYVGGLLSYLSKSNRIFYDTHYKTGSKFYGSPMYVFLNNKALKWAYYFVLIAAFFYIIFEGKRKQRNIPIITPLKNQTLDFVRTIANMYYEKSDHTNIANYKINQFMAFIRSQQPIGTTAIDDQQIKDIASRNGKSTEETKKLFDYIKRISQKQTINKEELMSLNQMIDDFKK